MPMNNNTIKWFEVMRKNERNIKIYKEFNVTALTKLTTL